MPAAAALRIFAAACAFACLPALGDAAVAANMRSAAQSLLASVDAAGRHKLILPFEDEKRTDWHYTPRSRPGLSFADLDAGQRDRVHRLLHTALDAAGHRKVMNIIELELVLREIETLGLFRENNSKAFVGQRERGGQTSDAGTGNDDRCAWHGHGRI